LFCEYQIIIEPSSDHRELCELSGFNFKLLIE
jgi:hypothetical protein